MKMQVTALSLQLPLTLKNKDEKKKNLWLLNIGTALSSTCFV